MLKEPCFSVGARYCPCNRLKRVEDFKKIFSSSQRSVDKQFVFIISQNGNKLARLGIAVPKRHIQSAVTRNRIKRVIRESFRLRKLQFSGFDLLVMVRRPLKEVDRKNFDLILDRNWQKIQCKG